MPDVVQPAPAEQKPKKRRLWLKILIGIVILIVIIIVLAFAMTSGAAKVSGQFLTAIQSDKADDAYALFTKEAAAATKQADFTALVKQAGPVLNGDTKTTSRESGTSTDGGSAAKVIYEIKGTDGVTYIVTVNLTKEDGSWKVLNFDSSQKE